MPPCVGITMSITKEQLRLAGWFSIANAAVTIPIFIVREFLDVADGIHLKIINLILSAISLGLVIYVTKYFKKVLNFCFKFNQVNKLVYVFVWSNVAVSVISFLLAEGNTIQALIVSILALITLGSIYMIFAIKLLSISENVSGLLIVFAFTIIAKGLCLATVILLPLSLLVSVVSDVVLGIIFFRAVDAS